MIDPFKAPGDDQLREMSGAKPSTSDSLLVKGKNGGMGGGARKVLEDRKAAEAEPEPLDMESAEPEAETHMDVEALLSFGAWSKPDTCFHEEAEVTVHLSLPKGKEHLTRIEAELHAEMESGLKLISKGEGHAQADGTAVFVLPVYQPDDYQGGIVKYALSFRHKIAKVLSPDDLFRMVSKTTLKSADHALIPGIAFSKDTSFIGPKAAEGLKLLESKFQEWEKKYPKKTKIVVYGHANPDEKDPKALSERRAQSAYAFITNNADAWEKLYSVEKWGLVVFQVLLQELGYYVGKPDGADGPRTQTALKVFQKKAGLPETGKEDAATRKALFSAYMKGKHDIQIDASRFRKVAGNPWMGCGCKNHAKDGDAPAPENRRVAFILSNESKFFPPNFPCQDGSESPCQRQCKREGKRSTPGIHCLFYDELVREEKQADAAEDPPTSGQGHEIETQWKYPKGGVIPRQNDYNDDILAAAKKHSIEPLLLKSLIAQESNFDPKAHNNSGFAGLTQIGGAAIKEAGLSQGATKKTAGKYEFDFTGDERFDSKKSIYGGALILSHKRRSIDTLIFSKYKKPLSEAEKQKFYLAAYNAGEGTVKNAWVENGEEDCVWEDLVKGGDKSALWKVIPESWVPEKKYYEITEYPVQILERKNS